MALKNAFIIREIEDHGPKSYHVQFGHGDWELIDGINAQLEKLFAVIEHGADDDGILEFCRENIWPMLLAAKGLVRIHTRTAIATKIAKFAGELWGEEFDGYGPENASYRLWMKLVNDKMRPQLGFNDET